MSKTAHRYSIPVRCASRVCHTASLLDFMGHFTYGARGFEIRMRWSLSRGATKFGGT
jgi:hypothetical protein